MANPTPKEDAMEDLLKAQFGFDRRDHIQANKCVPPPIGCGEAITSFDTELQSTEYRLSGLCSTCQDRIFGNAPEE